MPLILDTPKNPKLPTVKQEIVWFGVDTQALRAEVVVNDYDENGTVNDSKRHTIELMDDATPRFDPVNEYAVVKSLLYRLAIEDNLLDSGSIE